MHGEQLLEVGLDAVLHQAGVDPELMRAVVEHLVDGDRSSSPALLCTVHMPTP